MNQNEFKTLEELIEYFQEYPTQFKYNEQAMEQTGQDVVLDSVRRGLFMVGSVDVNGVVSFATKPIMHDNAHAARAESKRLAAANPGKAFIFVKLAGAELIPSARTISI